MFVYTLLAIATSQDVTVVSGTREAVVTNECAVVCIVEVLTGTV